MASVFDEPQCLVFTEPSTGKLCLDQSVLDQIWTIEKQVNSVAITGLYRTGKSYLLTRLAGKYKGFPLGSSIQAKTKGIWVWCVDHPVNTDQVLLLLDTEGLGDISKGNQNHDNQLFTIATLLCSTLIYNTFGAFDNDTLNKLNFITEMSKNMKTGDVSLASSSDADFDIYFPEFVLTLRDASLELEIDGREVTPDEYLNDYCLKAMHCDTEEVQRYNEPRLCLRKYFKRRKCFLFDRPTSKSKLKNLENMNDTELSEEFVEDTKKFLRYVHNSGRPMQLNNGTPVTGRMFVNLAKSYVDAIRQGSIPCIQNALRSMAIIENEAATEEAFGIYRQEMQRNVIFPTEDHKTLRDIHLRSKDNAFQHFIRRRVLDDDDAFKLKLDGRVKEEFKRIEGRNEEESKAKCTEALQCLHAAITTSINDGVYAVPGGFELYCKDREELKRQYDATTGLGVMKENAYVTYVEYTKNESEAVLKSDQTISEKELALHLEREAKKRAEEKEYLVQKQLQETKQAMLEMKAQQEKEFDELRKVHAKEMETERARMEDMSEKRMAEISRLQSENLRKVQERYEREMENEREAQNERDKAMQQNMDRMNVQLEKLIDENKTKAERMKELEDQLQIERINNTFWGWLLKPLKKLFF